MTVRRRANCALKLKSLNCSLFLAFIASGCSSVENGSESKNIIVNLKDDNRLTIDRSDENFEKIKWGGNGTGWAKSLVKEGLNVYTPSNLALYPFSGPVDSGGDQRWTFRVEEINVRTDQPESLVTRYVYDVGRVIALDFNGLGCHVEVGASIYDPSSGLRKQGLATKTFTHHISFTADAEIVSKKTRRVSTGPGVGYDEHVYTLKILHYHELVEKPCQEAIKIKDTPRVSPSLLRDAFDYALTSKKVSILSPE